jgi:hypothetical protein
MENICNSREKSFIGKFSPGRACQLLEGGREGGRECFATYNTNLGEYSVRGARACCLCLPCTVLTVEAGLTGRQSPQPLPRAPWSEVATVGTHVNYIGSAPCSCVSRPVANLALADKFAYMQLGVQQLPKQQY